MKFLKRSEFWLFLCLLATIFIYRLPYSFDSVIDWDESCYFVESQHMLHGQVLYKDIFDFKGPITFFMFASVIAAFGNSTLALHIFTTVYLLLNLVYVALISRRLFSNASYFIAAFIYGAFFTNQMGGISSNGELLMMLPVTIAAYHFIRYAQTKIDFDLFWCGFFSAAAVLIKQTAFFSVTAIFLGWMVMEVKYFQSPGKAMAKRTLTYIGGGMVPFLFFIIYFGINGALSDFLNFYLFVGGQYVSSTPLKEGIERFAQFMGKVSLTHFITILNYAGLLFCVFVYRQMTRLQKGIFYFFVLFMLCSFLGVFWGRNMFGHYYLQMALIFSLIPGLALSLLNLNSSQIKKMFVVSLIIFWSSVNGFQWQSAVARYKLRNTDLNRVIAKYIVEKTKPGDTIFVMSGHPIIYFLANREAPTKFFYWILYEERWIKIPHLKEITLEAFSKNKPKYMIEDLNSRGKIPYLEAFMQKNYVPEQIIGTYLIAKLKE